MAEPAVIDLNLFIGKDERSFSISGTINGRACGNTFRAHEITAATRSFARPGWPEVLTRAFNAFTRITDAPKINAVIIPITMVWPNDTENIQLKLFFDSPA